MHVSLQHHHIQNPNFVSPIYLFCWSVKMKASLNYWTKKVEKIMFYCIFPLPAVTLCWAVLKHLLFWKKTESPMEILPSPLDVIAIKHQKTAHRNRWSKSMQSIINHHLASDLSYFEYEIPKALKKGEKRIIKKDLPPAVKSISKFLIKFFLSTSMFY